MQFLHSLAWWVCHVSMQILSLQSYRVWIHVQQGPSINFLVWIWDKRCGCTNASQVWLCFGLFPALPLPAACRGGCCPQSREEEWVFLVKFRSAFLQDKAGCSSCFPCSWGASVGHGLTLPEEQVPGVSCSWTHAEAPGPARPVISKYFGALSGKSQSRNRH